MLSFVLIKKTNNDKIFERYKRRIFERTSFCYFLPLLFHEINVFCEPFITLIKFLTQSEISNVDQEGTIIMKICILIFISRSYCFIHDLFVAKNIFRTKRLSTKRPFLKSTTTLTMLCKHDICIDLYKIKFKIAKKNVSDVLIARYR